MNNIGIIGGADGPTAIFLSPSDSIFNTTGLVLVIMLLMPNILYALNVRKASEKCTNALMLLLEQLGRFGAMFFLSFHIGVLEYGYGSLSSFLLCSMGNMFLIVLYYFVWFLHFRKTTNRRSMILAVLPCILFLMNGICGRNVLLTAAAAVFTVGHIYVTRKNFEEKE